MVDNIEVHLDLLDLLLLTRLAPEFAIFNRFQLFGGDVVTRGGTFKILLVFFLEPDLLSMQLRRLIVGHEPRLIGFINGSIPPRLRLVLFTRFPVAPFAKLRLRPIIEGRPLVFPYDHRHINTTFRRADHIVGRSLIASRTPIKP